MQRINNIILKATMAILAVVLAAGCVFEKENPTASREYRNVLVQLGISTDPMTQTKADAAQIGNQTPTPDEKLVSSLRVYAYIGGALCGYLEDLDGVSEGEALLMDLRLPTSGNVTVDFVAIANEEKMSGTGDQISVSVERNPQGTLTFSKNIGMDEFKKIVYTLADQDFAKVGIPMYATGSKTINTNKVEKQNDAQGHEGHFLLKDILNITLTRSLAKVALFAAQAVEGTGVLETNNPSITIDKVTYFTEGILESGYLFPTETYPSDITTNKDVVFEPADGGVKKMIGTQNSANIGVSENYTQITEPYYLPENPMGADTWNQVADTDGMVIRIDYTYTGSSSTFAYVKMPPIVRNSFYKVMCLINAAGEIEIKYIVTDWTMADINVPNFE